MCGGRGSTVKGEDGFPPGVLVRPFVRGNVSTEQGREENTLKPPSLSGVHPTLPHTAPPPMQQRGIEAVPRTGEDGGRRRRPRSLPGRKRGGRRGRGGSAHAGTRGIERSGCRASPPPSLLPLLPPEEGELRLLRPLSVCPPTSQTKGVRAIPLPPGPSLPASLAVAPPLLFPASTFHPGKKAAITFAGGGFFRCPFVRKGKSGMLSVAQFLQCMAEKEPLFLPPRPKKTARKKGFFFFFQLCPVGCQIDQAQSHEGRV